MLLLSGWKVICNCLKSSHLVCSEEVEVQDRDQSGCQCQSLVALLPNLHYMADLNTQSVYYEHAECHSLDTVQSMQYHWLLVATSS